MSPEDSRRSAPRDTDEKLHRHAIAIKAYTAGVGALAIGLIVFAWARAPLSQEQIIPFVVLLLMGWLSTRLKEVDTGDDVGIAFTGVIYMSAVPLVGPAGAGLLGALVYLTDRTGPPIARAFNAGMTSVLASLGGLGYLASGGLLPVPGGQAPGIYLVHVGLPLLVTNLVVSTANLVILSGMVNLTGGEAKRFITGAVRETLPLYLAYTVICFLFVVLWVPAGVGPLSGVLILAPLLVAHWIYSQYGDEMRAHSRVLEALAAAGEGADRGGAGHSERVGAVCRLLAGQLGLNSRRTHSLHYAATLHDIGRLGISPATLRKPTAEATEADIAEIRRHPLIAEEIVRDIGFLREAATAIRHHHERVDGSGYPDGLSGSDIPLLARIVAVADAFEALVAPLGSRPAMAGPDAVAYLERRVGSHFDAEVVAALREALRETPWIGELEDLPPRRGDQLWWDHDDPDLDHLTAPGTTRRGVPG